MGKLFCVMGKSASGKDTLYRMLVNDKELNLNEVVIYTTRPMRTGEIQGVTYNFTDEEGFMRLKESGKIVEDRCYDTVYGPWRYFTVDDGKIDFENGSYIIIGTLESYVKIRDYFGSDKVEPIYVEVEDGERLIRSIRRGQQQADPGYEEICRRFLADSKDFSDEMLASCGISKHYDNIVLEDCFENIKKDIKVLS